MEKVLKVTLRVCVALLLGFLIGLVTFGITRSQTLKEIGLVVAENNCFGKLEIVKDDPNFVNKYEGFLNDEMAEWICKCSEDFGVDPDLVVAILKRENPSLITDAVSKMNENGTVDLGLFQLNDRSLENSFLKRWWNPEVMGEEFNAGNWKHNSYIAIRYIEDLQKQFGENNVFYIAAGYNAGPSRAWNEYTRSENGKWLPEITRNFYAPAVENNYKDLKKLS